MHSEDAVSDGCALGHEKRGFAVRPAADGEEGVFHGAAAVNGDDGVEAECWVKVSV